MILVKLKTKKNADILVKSGVPKKINILQKLLSFKEVDNIEGTMSTQSNIQKFEAQAKAYEQAAVDARCKAAEAAEKKEKKVAKKEARDKKKRDKLRKVHREEPNNDDEGPKLRETNVSFYLLYQQVINRLSVEFIIRMKEEKDSSLYDKFIEKVIQHIGAVDTSVWDVSIEDVVQTIKDTDCRYITGTSDSDSDEDNNDNDVISPIDVMKTFEKGELTRTVRDTITQCFNHLTEAHSMMKEAFIEAGQKVHVLPKRGMALLLEAMATRSIVVQDTKAFNILQEAKVHRRIRDEIKAQESKMCAIDLRLEKHKNCMLPNWRHQIFITVQNV